MIGRIVCIVCGAADFFMAGFLVGVIFAKRYQDRHPHRGPSESWHR